MSVFSLLCLSSFAALLFVAVNAAYDNNGLQDFSAQWQPTNDGNLNMQVSGRARGWLGVGFSKDGSMTNSNLAIVWIDPRSGQPQLSNRYATANQYPPINPRNVWKLTNGGSNGTHIFFQAQRPIQDNSPPYDLSLTTSGLYLLFAASDTVPQNAQSIQKHDRVYHMQPPSFTRYGTAG